MTRTPHKFGAVKTQVNSLLFASKAEAKRYGELLLLQRVGRITDLRVQVPYVLAPSVKLEGSKKAKPALRYVADFVYFDCDTQREMVVDVKGVVTALFRVKQHLMKSVLGIDVTLYP